MDEIFISYAREDRHAVEMLVKDLEARGLSVWWDREILAGQSFDQTIETALTSARCVIVVWSAASIASHWVRAEASTAREAGKLIPVRIAKVSPPLEFRMLQAVDWIESDGSAADGLTRLVKAIESQLGRQTAQPPPELHSKAVPRRSRQLTYGVIALAVLIVAMGAIFAFNDGRSNDARPASSAPLAAEGAAEINAQDSIAEPGVREAEAAPADDEPPADHAAPADKDEALVRAARSGDTETVAALLDQGANVNASSDGIPALIFAISGEHIDTVNLLLRRGANPNVTNREQTPGLGDTALAAAVNVQQRQIVRALLEKGADVNAGGGAWHETALMRALSRDDAEIVDTLLEYKPDLEIKNEKGETALIVAAHAPYDYVATLLAHGASVKATDNEGRTAVDWASERPDRLKMLSEAKPK